MKIIYKRDVLLDTVDIIRVFEASGITRPTQDPTRISQMFIHSNLVFSAWDNEKLIGVCRSLTDFNYACYLSDLAVDKHYQSVGVGKELIKKVRDVIGEKVALILLSAPSAIDYYPKIGFDPINNGFIIKRKY
jgi:ribosomal protein S18 acetylase RimI-like enzyme